MGPATLHTADTPAQLFEQTAGWLAGRIAARLREADRCRLALAGGSTPRGLYALLATPAWQARIDWARIELLWGDERCVPPDDPASNHRMAREALIDRLDVAPAAIHRVEGERPAAEAAARYAALVHAAPVDVALLGMGGDGHTASLFPGSAALDSDAAALATRSPEPPHDRVTLGRATFDRAGAVAFVVLGAGKATRVAQVLAQLARPVNDETLPAARIRPARGDLHWFLGDGAGAALE